MIDMILNLLLIVAGPLMVQVAACIFAAIQRKKRIQAMREPIYTMLDGEVIELWDEKDLVEPINIIK